MDDRMDRLEAQQILYEIINSGIISGELEDSLQRIINALECGEGFTGASMDAVYARGDYCHGCPELKFCKDGKRLLKGERI